MESSAGKECRTFRREPLPLPLSVQVQLPPLSAGEAALSLPGAAKWILLETLSALGSPLPASSVEWLPGAPLRSSRN